MFTYAALYEITQCACHIYLLNMIEVLLDLDRHRVEQLMRGKGAMFSGQSMLLC